MDVTAGATRLVVDEALGARVASLLVPTAGGDGELQLAGRYAASPHGWGAFPMAPWAGRVRNGQLTWDGVTHQLPVSKPPHAIHGLVATAVWEVVEHEESSAVLRREVGDQWPWKATAVLRYHLAPTELTIVLEVHADDVAMPAWCGLHPWFPRSLGGVDVELDLTAAGMLVRDEAGIATAEVAPIPLGAPMDPPVDDTFTQVSWPVVLTWPGVARLEVSADVPWAVVFTERQEAVCVEPQTAPPDATALGLAATVEPGAPLVLTTRWRWSVV